MNPKPSAKTGYTALGGAVVTITAWVITQVAGIGIPAEIAAAATTLVAAVIALLVPAKSGTYVENPDLDWPAGESMADYATDDEEV